MKIAVGIVLALFSVGALQGQSAAPLKLEKTIPLPNTTGRFDHFAFDPATNTLFAAAPGSHAVERVNISTGKMLPSIDGLLKPHGVVWVPQTQRLYVADGSRAELLVYQGPAFQLLATLKLSDDADDMVYSSASGLLYVGHGGGSATDPGRIAVVDTKSFTRIADIPVSAHPEALELDPKQNRIFANIADAAQVAVIDDASHRVKNIWSLRGAADNVPMAYDEEHHALIIACRKPAVVLLLDADTGQEISRVTADSGADDLFYDAHLHQVYVVTGAGWVDVYTIDTQKRLLRKGVVRTEAGAKTGLWVPARNRLYVGVPGNPAQIRIYAPPAGQ